MQSISPETIFRGENAWRKSLPHITKLTKRPLILGRSTYTKNLRNKIYDDLRNQNLKSTPQGVSYNTVPKGNISIKMPTPNLTQPLQESPLPSNNFYK